MPVSVWMGLVSFTAKKYSIHLIYSSLFCPAVVWTSSRSFIRLDMFKLDLEWTVEGRGGVKERGMFSFPYFLGENIATGML